MNIMLKHNNNRVSLSVNKLAKQNGNTTSSLETCEWLGAICRAYPRKGAEFVGYYAASLIAPRCLRRGQRIPLPPSCKVVF